METMQNLAALEVLAFLATFAALAGVAFLAVLVPVIGESRLKGAILSVFEWLFSGRGLFRKVAAAGLILLGGYSTALLAAGLASRDRTLGPGEEKYFCEVDCHLAYAVTGVVIEKSLGNAPDAPVANGTFYVVTLRTRFDRNTISAHRPLDAPLWPNPRHVWAVDDQGRRFAVDARGEDWLEHEGAAGVPLLTPLRPGESYETHLVFDLPTDARKPRLLVTSTVWAEPLVVGDERSPFHGKIYLSLIPATR